MDDAAPIVLAFGEALWDVFCHAGGRRERRVGGAPANFAYHVAQHGLSACAVSALGEDAAGEALAAALAESGVPCAFQRVPYATGEVEVELEAGGIPRYTIRPNAAWDHIAVSLDLIEMASRARALCFGTLAQRCAESRCTLQALLAAMPTDSWRILDVNLRCGFHSTELLRSSFRLANVLKLNEEEMELIARAEGFCGLPQLEQARLLMERYALRYLILTCGAIGSYVMGQGGAVLSYLPTPQVHVVDTVGAGDSFTASFIAALLLGRTLPQAHAAAVQVAAYVCTQPGAMAELPQGMRLSCACS